MATNTNNAIAGSAADIYASINAANKRASSGSTAQEMEDRFLTLLMTQMKNQDPLNPLDNAQVTTQLAQLNTVSGIEKLNATMGQLLTGYNEALAMQATNMIGRNVMVPGKNLPLYESKAIGGVLLEGKADKVVISIKDKTGAVVQTQDLGEREAGSFFFGWDGTDADGNVLTDGDYTFSVTATLGGQKVEANVMQVGTVSAVVRGKNGFTLDLGAFGSFDFKDVQQVI